MIRDQRGSIIKLIVLYNQPAPAFIARVFEIFFPAVHRFFDARTIGPTGALAYGKDAG